MDPPYEIGWFITVRGVRHTLLRKMLQPLENFFSRRVRLGLPFELVLENFYLVRKSRVIFCCCDPISFAFLWAKAVGLIDSRVITLFHSLSERHIKYFTDNPSAIWMVRRLLAQSDKILTLSQGARKHLINEFSLKPERVDVFHFGADTEFWSFRKWDRSRNQILAVGNDMNRDYSTLLDALLKEYRITLVTNQSFRQHENLKVLSGISNTTLRKIYQSARIVVIPSVRLKTECSGLSTTLQAMACGTPVLISDCPVLRELFQEDEHIFYYEPESTQSLKNKIESIWNNEKLLQQVSLNACRIVNDIYNEKNMNLQLKKLFGIRKNSNL